MTEEIIIDGVDVAGCNAYKEGHCLDKTAILLCDTNKCSNYNDCYYKQLKRLEQENKKLSFAIEKCLENAGIECDDEEQALRSLPMLGNAHYKVLVEKEELEQENAELRERLSGKTFFCENCEKLARENEKLKSQYNCYACDTCSGKEDYRNMKRHCGNAIKTVHTYRSALEEISLIIDELKQQYDYMSDYSEIKEIQDKINEVLGNESN